MSNTAPSRANPVVVFPLGRWCPPQETSQPHPPQNPWYSLRENHRSADCGRKNTRSTSKPPLYNHVENQESQAKLRLGPAKSPKVFKVNAGTPSWFTNFTQWISRILILHPEPYSLVFKTLSCTINKCKQQSNDNGRLQIISELPKDTP